MNNLKRARLLVDMTAQEVADKLHVTRQTIHNWESGRAEPNNAYLIMLSELYRTTVDNLLKGESQ